MDEYIAAKHEITNRVSIDLNQRRYNFFKELYESGAGFSGSFLLDCPYGTNSFSYRDLNLRFTQFLYQCGFSTTRNCYSGDEILCEDYDEIYVNRQI